MSRDSNHDIGDISGGAFSDWISGTDTYTVPVGYANTSFANPKGR